VLTTLISNMGDMQFHAIAHPYTDATSLTAIENELSSRFGPLRMIDGVAITSAKGTVSQLGTLAGTRNSPHSVIVAQDGDSHLTPPAEFAAAVAGVVAYEAPIDPARPFQTLVVGGVVAQDEADRFTTQERNTLLYDNVATTKVVAGQVQVDRLVTTYATSAAGSPDTAYLDLTTPLTLMYLRYSWRVWMLARYPRHKLADDGVRFGAGQPIITPSIGKGEALAWFRAMEELGLVEGYDQFQADLVVERSATDPNRLNFTLSPDLINQMIVGATTIKFLL
jgi:phage tail sheath gpL-like